MENFQILRPQKPLSEYLVGYLLEIAFQASSNAPPRNRIWHTPPLAVIARSHLRNLPTMMSDFTTLYAFILCLPAESTRTTVAAE